MYTTIALFATQQKVEDSAVVLPPLTCSGWEVMDWIFPNVC